MAKGRPGARTDRQERDPGANVAGRKQPDAVGTKRSRNPVHSRWGELPDYILNHRRGSMPSVPEKYRRYMEALTKGRQDRQPKDR